jgi:uncharacterized RDD family membrane protein YckC
VTTIRGLPDGALEQQGHRAGIVTRLLANGVDFSVVLTVLVGMWAGWAALRFLRSPGTFSWPAPNGLVVVAAFEVVAFVYFTVSWATTGRTIGNVLLGLRVVNFRGQRMRWSGAALRAAFCVVFWIGLLWVAVSPQNRSVQDVVLRTSVVYDWRR